MLPWVLALASSQSIARALIVSDGGPMLTGSVVVQAQRECPVECPAACPT